MMYPPKAAPPRVSEVDSDPYLRPDHRRLLNVIGRLTDKQRRGLLDLLSQM